MLKCTKCGEFKAVECFGVDTRKKNGRTSSCKDCKSLKNKEDYAKDREKNISRTLSYYRQNREKMREQQNLWKKDNRERMNAYEALRSAQKDDRTPGWLSEEDKQWLDCIYETAKEVSAITQEPHHVDHIMPLRGKTVCGLHVPWNLQIIPAQENMSKGNRLT